MNFFHNQVLSEIESARKLAAEFASRHGRMPARLAQGPGAADRQAQKEAAAAEIAALAAEEERLTHEARERAEQRAQARVKENVLSGEIRDATATLTPETAPPSAPELAPSRWNAMAILKGLAKLRVKEQSAAEELIRKALAIRNDSTPTATVSARNADEPGPDLPTTPIRGMWMPAMGADQRWFFTSEGTRCGPVTFADLRTMAASRVLDPRRDLVWKNGMEDWKQAGLLDGLFERCSVPAEPTDRRRVRPAMPVAALPTQLNAALASKHMFWPGTGRLGLWLGLLLFPVLWSGILRWCGPILVSQFGNTLVDKVIPWLALLPVPVLVFLVLTRLVNLGMSRWWALGLGVPIINLWLAFRCLCCSPGHAHHRKLDRTGLVIALATLVAVPTAGWLYIYHPGLLSPSKILDNVSGWIAGIGRLTGRW